MKVISSFRIIQNKTKHTAHIQGLTHVIVQQEAWVYKEGLTVRKTGNGKPHNPKYQTKVMHELIHIITPDSVYKRLKLSTRHDGNTTHSEI